MNNQEVNALNLEDQTQNPGLGASGELNVTGVYTAAPVKQEIAPVQETAPAAVEEKPKSALELLAEKKMEELKALNPEFKLDYMNVFTRVKVNSKGQFFYILGGEETKLTDQISTRLITGEYMYQLWGEKGTENEGDLLCYSKDHVTNCDGGKCAECPHDYDKCKLRYALVMNLLMNDEDPEDLFNINISSTGAYAFADYVKLIAKKYKKGVSEVKTTIITEERPVENSKDTYNAILFKYAENQ